jgi:hypothetical protein
MGKNSIIGTWVGVCALVAVVFGGLEHASRTDPSGVDTARVATARVAIRGIVIPPFN